MKPGKTTTEFWLMIGFGLMILANGTYYIDVDGETMRWFGGMVATYVAGRSYVKAQNGKES